MKTWHQYYVYILQCKDGSYYIGITNDLERRVEQHNSGYNPTCYTYNKRPVILMHYENFQFVQNAIAREKQLKGWSRKKKEALFAGNWEELKRLAKSKNKDDEC